MAEAGTGGAGPEGISEASGAVAGVAPEDGRDWAGGLPADVLAKVAETLVAQDEAGYAARLRENNPNASEDQIQNEMAWRKHEGNCLFVFARVCKGWRETQLKVGGPLRTRVKSDVIKPGSVALMKWALAEGCPRDDGGGSRTLAWVAARCGHEELVRWLIQEQGFAMDWTVMISAAVGGNLELVKWLRGEGCDWSETTCMRAAEAGRLGVLKWLRANGCPWNARTCDLAAQFGHLETLRWAHENGCPWSGETCYNAAYGGHLEILQWLRANGCPWHRDACYYAVDRGHVETLRWARENGCPWVAETRDRAAAELGYTDDLGNLVG